MLHQTIAISGVILTFFDQKYPLGITYDAFNPAVMEGLKNWMCLICGMHFGTIKIMFMYRRSCKHVHDNAESNSILDEEETVAECAPIQ